MTLTMVLARLETAGSLSFAVMILHWTLCTVVVWPTREGPVALTSGCAPEKGEHTTAVESMENNAPSASPRAQGQIEHGRDSALLVYKSTSSETYKQVTHDPQSTVSSCHLSKFDGLNCMSNRSCLDTDVDRHTHAKRRHAAAREIAGNFGPKFLKISRESRPQNFSFEIARERAKIRVT